LSILQILKNEISVALTKAHESTTELRNIIFGLILVQLNHQVSTESHKIDLVYKNNRK
jgi:hypothetical protein